MFSCGFPGMLFPPMPPRPAAAGEDGPCTARDARVGFVNGEVTRVRRMTQICGGAAGRK